MPPKSNTRSNDLNNEDPDLSTMIKEVLSSQKRIEENQGKMEERLDSMLNNIRDIQSKQVDTDSSILNLMRNQNMAEQHTRNFSVRVFNFPIPADSMNDCVKTSKLLYSTLFVPILKIAVSEGDIESVPSLLNVIEYAHVLPSRGSGGIKVDPIIVRLQSRLLRNLLFKYKSKYFKSNPSCKCSIFEDLTSHNFKLLKSMQDDESVLRAWSVGGRCKFIRKSNPEKIMTAVIPFSTPSGPLSPGM